MESLKDFCRKNLSRNKRMSKFENISPETLHLLSFNSEMASDIGFISIYETAEKSDPRLDKGFDPSNGFNLITDNGLVDFDGNLAPYTRIPFVENPDYACIGCSCTVSKGLPVEYSWASLVRKFTGKTVNSYSEIGAGYRKLVTLSLHASIKYGPPKEVLALLPDPYRVWFPYSWLRKDDDNQIVFGHTYWENDIKSYMHNHMGSGIIPCELVDHNGRKHLLSPEIAAFENVTAFEAYQSMCSSMGIPLRSMTWYRPEDPEEIDKHNIFTIKRNPNIRLETSTNFFEKFQDMEREIGGEGRWRRMGAPSRTETCDHVPLTDYQERFWYIAANSRHPGLHDQIHFAEQLLGVEIPCSLMEEIP